MITENQRFWADTTRPLVEHLRQVYKKSDQWSRRRCDTKIVTVLSKGQLVILKMAAVWPYLLKDRNCFRVDTSRHWEEFICKVSKKFLNWFQRRGDNGENQRSYFYQNHFWADTTRPLGEHLRLFEFRKHLTSGLVGEVITRKSLRMPDGPLLDKLYW